MAFPMKKVSPKKHPAPHRKSFAPAKEKGKTSRKSGKGTSLMHAAAKKQSESAAGDSNYTPIYGSPEKGVHNRADVELKRLQGNND